jgi:hypothetical protein
VTPGWYADPHGGPDLRWWDGSTWTEHTSPPVGAAPSATTPVPAADAAAAADPWAAPVGAPAGAPGGDQWAAPVGAPAGAPGGDQWAAPVGTAEPPSPVWAAGAPQAGPGVPGGPGGPAGPGSTGGFPPPQQAGSSNRTLLVALGVGVALLLVIGGVVLFSGGDDEPSADPTTTTADTSVDTTTTTEADTTTTEPETLSETVASGALSFTRLPAPWDDWVASGRSEIPELENTAGQYVVVQENAPSGGQWIGNLLIGDLAPSIAYSGEADLAAATQALTDQLVASYYVTGATATPVQSIAIDVDGHPAHFIHTELSFSQAGLDTTNEKVIVVVVETGADRPSVFWASIPYNRADLNGGMDEVYRSLTVDG